MTFERRTGILLHPTSLPSKGGIGDLGPAAYAFADFLAEAGQSLWQVLPLNPVGLGYSPYSAVSAFAGNPLLISLEMLAKYGWITEAEIAGLPQGNGNIDYKTVEATKLPLLRKAAHTFLNRPPDSLGEHDRYGKFCVENAWWLDDFALFNTLRSYYKNQSWNNWPKELASRQPAAVHSAKDRFAAELAIERVLQFAFFEQWHALHQYCGERGIRIIGDVAIFVNYDSADVWTNPDVFHLNANLEPTIVAGVPPDAFSATGQRWGNPLYRWEVLKGRGYDWWIKRMSWALKSCDYLRLDHFRGFAQFWEIPASEPNAVRGRWVDGPGESLFQALKQALGDLPFIAEDLGLITPDVEALRQRLGIPGMKVLQFGFGDPGAHIYLPHKYDAHCVAYTGTHDNDTTLGWWQQLGEEERRNVFAYVGEAKDGIHWAMIRLAQNSIAAFTIAPLQDVLGLDGDARMNTPSRVENNWGWRYQSAMLKPAIAKKLASLAEVADRKPARNTN